MCKIVKCAVGASLVMTILVLIAMGIGCTKEQPRPTPQPTATPILYLPTSATSTALVIKSGLTCNTIIDYTTGEIKHEGECQEDEVALAFWKMIYSYNPQVVGYQYETKTQEMINALTATARSEARRRELQSDLETLTRVIAALTGKIDLLTSTATPVP